jgi:hypothetical protein
MNVDDDGIKMFGMVLIVAVILILLSTCVLQTDTEENGVKCAEGQVYLENLNCCSIDGVSCFQPPLGCVEVDCNDPNRPCCEPDVCEIQSDGSELCLPCDEATPCIPDRLPCCEDMFCYLGFCKECEDFPCDTDKDCCDAYECNYLLCIPCKRPCTFDDEDGCCVNWECTEELICEDCDRPCVNNLDCCADGTCNPVTLKCEGCKEGAYCDEDMPCCSDYGCNLDTNRCEACRDRPCETKEDCCVNGICNPFTNMCQYADDCDGIPCSPTQIGEPCLLDPTCDIDVEDCTVCEDETICLPNKESIPTCRLSFCPRGQVPCHTLGIPLEKENCVCCHLNGKCADENVHDCKIIGNCQICSCISYTVQVCPPNNFYCPDYGCFNPSPVYQQTDGLLSSPDEVCKPCKVNSDACCSYYVPDDAIPSGVSKVDYSFCISGYYSTQHNSCISSIDYTLTDKYNYQFNLPAMMGTPHTSTSSIEPTEVVISTVFIPKKNECNYIASNVVGVTFTQPTPFVVGGD